MKETTVAILKRLAKGKSGLAESELLAFVSDLQSAQTEDVRSAVFPLKSAKKATKSAAPLPAWLVQMEAARKRIKWTATEAAQRLLQLALDEGLLTSNPYEGKKVGGFAVVAKKIASLSNGERLATTYVREVSRLEREYALG
jgi:hypothetical protein